MILAAELGWASKILPLSPRPSCLKPRFDWLSLALLLGLYQFCSGKSGTLRSLISPAQANQANHSSLINPAQPNQENHSSLINSAQTNQAKFLAWSILLRKIKRSGKWRNHVTWNKRHCKTGIAQPTKQVHWSQSGHIKENGYTYLFLERVFFYYKCCLSTGKDWSWGKSAGFFSTKDFHVVLL